MWGVSTAVFAMLYLVPGDPVSAMLSESGASVETIARIRHQLGLDDPIPVQYVRFLTNAVQGNLGNSLFQNRPVTTIILEQLPATIELTVASMAIAISVGLLLGTLAAVRQDSWIDRASILLATLGVAMPSFWLGLLFIFFFSLTL